MKLLEKKYKPCKVIYYFCKIPFFKIKDKGTRFKLYLFGVSIGIINKSLFRRFSNWRFSRKYTKQLFKANYKKSSDFVDITDKPYKSSPDDVKPIAFYLPQFYTFPLNDKNFGKGFTEWTNVTKAIPHFIGHHQPQLPIDVGFYNLAHDDIMYRQIELAKMYGIYGFCFHYYWFSGTRMMEKPIFNWLNNKELDFPFCLHWANENWSKLWDGGNKELIFEQKLLDGDDEKFFYDILPFFKDERYIKINNKPLFIVYRPQLFSKERFQKFMNIMKNLSIENGFDGIFFCCTNCRMFDEQEEWGFDALIEFPPHYMQGLLNKQLITEFCNKDFTCNLYDMKDYIENKKYFIKTNSTSVIKSIFPSWDNTARKAYSHGGIFIGETPKLYKQWLLDILNWTKQNRSKDTQFVFINAWNEWAEGAHLEPDNRYGYAYLQATKEAMEECNI